MKHLQAGAMIGIIVAGLLLVASSLWVLLTSILGTTNAAAFTAIVLVASISAAVIDWMTERQRKE